MEQLSAKKIWMVFIGIAAVYIIISAFIPLQYALISTLIYLLIVPLLLFSFHKKNNVSFSTYLQKKYPSLFEKHKRKSSRKNEINVFSVLSNKEDFVNKQDYKLEEYYQVSQAIIVLSLVALLFLFITNAIRLLILN